MPDMKEKNATIKARQPLGVAMATSSLSLPFSMQPLILAAFQSAGHVGVRKFLCAGCVVNPVK